MAYDMFFKIGAIKGEAQDATYGGADGWIDILAWSWGVSNSGTTHLGSGSGSGKANFQDISITKYVDLASMDLLKTAAKGTHHPEADLIVRKAGDKPLDYLVYKLKDVIITSVSTGGSGGEDRLTENVSVNFGAFEVKYTQQMVDGSAGDAPEFKFDIAANVET
jgi:type VI secretion system secreted protein Hcp